MAMLAKQFSFKVTFLRRLRQAEPKVASLLKDAAVPSLTCGSHVTGMPPAQLEPSATDQAENLPREDVPSLFGPGLHARRCWN